LISRLIDTPSLIGNCSIFLQALESPALSDDSFNLGTNIPQVAATYAAINLNYSIHGALKQINAM